MGRSIGELNSHRDRAARERAVWLWRARKGQASMRQMLEAAAGGNNALLAMRMTTWWGAEHDWTYRECAQVQRRLRFLLERQSAASKHVVEVPVSLTAAFLLDSRWSNMPLMVDLAVHRPRTLFDGFPFVAFEGH